MSGAHLFSVLGASYTFRAIGIFVVDIVSDKILLAHTNRVLHFFSALHCNLVYLNLQRIRLWKSGEALYLEGFFITDACYRKVLFVNKQTFVIKLTCIGVTAVFVHTREASTWSKFKLIKNLQHGLNALIRSEFSVTIIIDMLVLVKTIVNLIWAFVIALVSRIVQEFSATFGVLARVSRRSLGIAFLLVPPMAVSAGVDDSFVYSRVSILEFVVVTSTFPDH